MMRENFPTNNRTNKMSDFKMMPDVLLEVQAFESFARRDFKRVLAHEAEAAHEFARAAALEAKAREDELAGLRMLDRLERPVEWKARFQESDSVEGFNACVFAAKV